MLNRPKLCYIVSSPMTISAFLSPHINFCSSKFDIFIVANFHKVDFLNYTNVTVLHLPTINRKINFYKDILALIALIKIFRKFNFDIIHSVTPKAGLLAQVAGWFVRVPNRIHTFTGQVWVNKSNPRRFFLKSLDRLIAMCATFTLVDSESQRDFLLCESVIDPIKSTVLNHGSISGVDVKKFQPNGAYRSAVRAELNIPDNALVLLFLGRLNADKGVLDLVEAYVNLAHKYPNLWLLLIGPDEQFLENKINDRSVDVRHRVVRIGYTDVPERYYNVADIFCLPSYREGFGTSVIEAGSCGVPAVASRIYGLTDAVVDQVTGLLHTVGNVSDLSRCLEQLLMDTYLRKKMGTAARERVDNCFQQDQITKSLSEFYQLLSRTRT